MYTIEAIEKLNEAVEANDKGILEEYVIKNPDQKLILEQFDVGTPKEIPVFKLYEENDEFNELWKGIDNDKYYVRATEFGGEWYSVCDPLGYCERNSTYKDYVIFIVCDSNGNPLFGSSNLNPRFPRLKDVEKAEWNKIKDAYPHIDEDEEVSWWSEAFGNGSTLSVDKWLLTYKDPSLYETEIREMFGYDENWVRHYDEISKVIIDEFDYLGEKYAIYQVTCKHQVCGVEWIEYYAGRKNMDEYENYTMFFASWFDATKHGNMVKKSA